MIVRAKAVVDRMVVTQGSHNEEHFLMQHHDKRGDQVGIDRVARTKSLDKLIALRFRILEDETLLEVLPHFK
jgi:hypothetical protein